MGYTAAVLGSIFATSSKQVGKSTLPVGYPFKSFRKKMRPLPGSVGFSCIELRPSLNTSTCRNNCRCPCRTSGQMVGYASPARGSARGTLGYISTRSVKIPAGPEWEHPDPSLCLERPAVFVDLIMRGFLNDLGPGTTGSP